MNGEVVGTFTFLEKSSDGGVVEVLVPTSISGRTHGSVQVRLHTGRGWVSLPRRGLTEIIEALQRAKIVADEQYKKLVEKMNGEGHG